MNLVRRFGSRMLQSFNQTRNTASRFLHSIRNSPFIRPTVLHTCPVCENTRALLLQYPSFDTPGITLPQHVKYECLECGHVSTDWFPSTDKLGELYERSYPSATESTNFRINSEIELVNRLIERLGSNITILDFSCGDNYPILDRDFEAELYACDVRPGYPYTGDRFFEFDPNSEPEQKYQAIFSVDAIEHISELEPTWEYFNNALKEGGLMAHSFPMATDFPRGHLFYKIPFHFCLFSENSLERWANKMGFSYHGTGSLPGSDVEKVYWFEKVETI